MPIERPNIIVLLALLVISLVVTFVEAAWKGILSLITGTARPLRHTRLLRIWHWIALDGPKQFWKAPTWYHASRSLATLLEVLLYPKNN